MLKRMCVCLSLLSSLICTSQTSQQWNIPELGISNDNYINSLGFALIDMDGDGLTDMIDPDDFSSGGEPYYNGAQKFWRVYLNNGSGFNATWLQWNIPETNSNDNQVYTLNFAVIDINGDAKPDLVDSHDHNTNDPWLDGSQKYWKVYLNTGDSFSQNWIQWNIPELNDSQDHQVFSNGFSTLDMNGDGLPDLIDSESDVASEPWTNGSQRYWRVYLNNGSGFNQTFVQWDIPELNDTQDHHVGGITFKIVDMNGDGKPDLIDGQDFNTGDVWIDGSQKYWKVFLNNGSSFESAFIQWNIPEVNDNDSQISNSRFGLIDLNGDGKPELIDSDDPTGINEPFYNGSQKYWKVYLNTTFAFNLSPIQWNIPELNDSQENLYLANRFGIVDFNGDGIADIVDCSDHNTGSVFETGGQKYWNLWTNDLMSIESESYSNIDLVIFPNPVLTKLNLFSTEISNASYKIFSMNGIEIQNGDIIFNNETSTIDVSSLSSGHYILGISSGNKIVVRRVQINHL